MSAIETESDEEEMRVREMRVVFDTYIKYVVCLGTSQWEVKSEMRVSDQEP